MTLPLVGDDDAADATLQRTYERIRIANGGISNLYRTLANAPDMLEAWIEFAWKLRFAPATDRLLREVGIMKVAHLTQAPYEWAAHWRLSMSLGMDEGKLADIPTWEESDRFSPEEELVLEAATELTRGGHLDDATLSRLQATFGDAQTVELVLTIAFYSCVARVLEGLHVPQEPVAAGQPPLPPLP
jgi:alkylhydroperoxidase family enzyme